MISNSVNEKMISFKELEKKIFKFLNMCVNLDVR